MTTISSATGITSALNATYKQLNTLKAASGSLANASSGTAIASAIKSTNASNRVAALLGAGSTISTGAASTLLSTGASSEATALAQSMTALYTVGNKKIASLQEQFSGVTAANMTDAQKTALGDLMRKAITSQSQSLIALSA
jgi:hypothetical protein